MSVHRKPPAQYAKSGKPAGLGPLQAAEVVELSRFAKAFRVWPGHGRSNQSEPGFYVEVNHTSSGAREEIAGTARTIPSCAALWPRHSRRRRQRQIRKYAPDKLDPHPYPRVSQGFSDQARIQSCPHGEKSVPVRTGTWRAQRTWRQSFRPPARKPRP